MPQCSAVTLKRTQCSRNASVDGLCTQHAQKQGIAGPAAAAPRGDFYGPSLCAGRDQPDCTPPACNWRVATAKTRAHCVTKKKTQHRY